MSKHSPGPWRICGEDRGGCSCGQVWSIPSDYPVAEATWRSEEVGDLDIDVMKANARLIAAAPELLETLKELMTAVVTGGEYRRAINKAIEVVKKAEQGFADERSVATTAAQ